MQCPNCRTNLPASAASCFQCGSLVDVFGTTGASAGFGDFDSATTSAQFDAFGTSAFQTSAGLRRVELWRRALTVLFDSFLFSLTFGVGWWIWFLLIAGRGQTPAKMLMRTRVVAFPSLTGVSGMKTVTRYLVPSLVPQLVLMQTVFGLISLPFGFGVIWLIIIWVAALLPLVDALWLFGPAKRRLIDVLLNTDVRFL